LAFHWERRCIVPVKTARDHRSSSPPPLLHLHRAPSLRAVRLRPHTYPTTTRSDGYTGFINRTPYMNSNVATTAAHRYSAYAAVARCTSPTPHAFVDSTAYLRVPARLCLPAAAGIGHRPLLPLLTFYALCLAATRPLTCSASLRPSTAATAPLMMPTDETGFRTRAPSSRASRDLPASLPCAAAVLLTTLAGTARLQFESECERHLHRLPIGAFLAPTTYHVLGVSRRL